MIREFLDQVLIIIVVVVVASHVRSVRSNPSFEDVKVWFLNAFSGVLFERDRDLKGVEVYEATVRSCRIWTLGTLRLQN